MAWTILVQNTAFLEERHGNVTMCSRHARAQLTRMNPVRLELKHAESRARSRLETRRFEDHQGLKHR